jgi:hypothetical protein
MKLLLALGVVLSSATGAAAQAPSNNASEMICRSTGAVGSRLARTRICRTRAEWDNLRRGDRQAIDRAQTRQFNLTIDEKGKMH